MTIKFKRKKDNYFCHIHGTINSNTLVLNDGNMITIDSFIKEYEPIKDKKAIEEIEKYSESIKPIDSSVLSIILSKMETILPKKAEVLENTEVEAEFNLKEFMGIDVSDYITDIADKLRNITVPVDIDDDDEERVQIKEVQKQTITEPTMLPHDNIFTDIIKNRMKDIDSTSSDADLSIEAAVNYLNLAIDKLKEEIKKASEK